MKRTFTLLCLLLATACSLPLNDVQTSSGAAFLAGRNTPVDTDIAAAASVEPNLQFPARIGIARVNSGGIAEMSTIEANAFDGIEIDTNQVGTFVAVSSFASNHNVRDGVHEARLHAAQQHLDYIIAYKVSQDGSGLNATGRIEIAFVDVRNGYVYGRLAVEDSTAGLRQRRLGYRDWVPSDEAAAKLIKAAIPDMAEMLTQLVNRSRGA